MLFNSLHFLIFFPAVVLIYYLISDKFKYLWLLAASYYFYMSWNAKYGLLLLTATFITYLSGMALERAGGIDRDGGKNTGRRKAIVAASFILCLGLLFWFKYAGYTIELITAALSRFGIGYIPPKFDIVLPVGISFYTFQALSYTMDVYRGEVPAEKNFFRYALYVSFFPQLVAGPIERYENISGQLRKPVPFDFDRARDGLLLMIWGYFLKLVIADRVAIFVDTVYADPAAHPGFYIIVASALFAVQIYCDFAGYSYIAMGTAEIIGIKLMDNFRSPFLGTTMKEVWAGWHISLTTWFRDYLYFPLGGNRKGIVRKYLNQIIIFVASGLWHGANISFVIWGGLNGLYLVVADLLKPVRDRLTAVLHLNRDSFGHKLAGCLISFGLFDFAAIFFRASGLHDSIVLISSIIHDHNPWILFDGSLYKCGLDRANFNLMIVAILVLTVADIYKKKGIKIRELISKQDYWFRWLVIVGSICTILVFGIWGSQYNEAAFIYFRF